MSQDPAAGPASMRRSENDEVDETPAGSAGLGARRRRPVPIGRVLLYYAVFVVLLAVLAWLFPLVRHAFLSPINAPVVSGRDFLTGATATAGAGNAAEVGQTLVRSGTTLLVVVGALALALPVAWVYMFTKRLRYDASLVQSIIILPIVVAGILIVVKNSLALAFSLAGIVAAVRFRNTLKDPKDAVYIFLALGIGIASGVQALDIALVLSFSFNLVVLALWKFNIGAIYSREYGPRGILSVGDRSAMVAQTHEARGRIRARLAPEAGEMKTDGILLVHSGDPDPARHAVESSLGALAKDWRLADTVGGPGGIRTLEFLVELKKKGKVVDILSELDDRWPAQVMAAEFIPFRARESDGERDHRAGE